MKWAQISDESRQNWVMKGAKISDESRHNWVMKGAKISDESRRGWAGHTSSKKGVQITVTGYP